jgi:hypothetical protein
MTYRGKVKSGVVVLDGGVRLPDGATVQVDLLVKPDDENGPSLLDRLKPVVGKATGLS